MRDKFFLQVSLGNCMLIFRSLIFPYGLFQHAIVISGFVK